jgi:DNA-binding transcriptional LysR family regulator
MKVSIRQIRYVWEVASTGSIQGASKKLNISQTSITAAIDVAEYAVGARIFDRRPARGISVTPAGERFLAAARTILTAEDEFSRAVNLLAVGNPPSIKIGCFESFGSLWLPEVLRRYIEEFGPTEFVLMEGDQPRLRDWLATGAVDLIVSYDIGEGFGPSVVPICRTPAHAALPANHPLASKETVRISDLAASPFVLLDLPETSTYILTLFDVFSTRPSIVVRSRSYQSVKAAVAAGLGVSIFNTRPMVAGIRDDPGIVRRPILDELPAPMLITADVYGNAKPQFVVRLIECIKRFFEEAGPQYYSVSWLPVNSVS